MTAFYDDASVTAGDDARLHFRRIFAMKTSQEITLRALEKINYATGATKPCKLRRLLWGNVYAKLHKLGREEATYFSQFVFAITDIRFTQT